VQLLLWHAINKGILIDWSTIYVVSVLISDEIIIMQQLGACNFLKCYSNTLIPINYVMGSNIYSLSLALFPQVLKIMQRNIKLNNKQKADVMQMTNFDYIAKCAVHCTSGSIALLHIGKNQ